MNLVDKVCLTRNGLKDDHDISQLKGRLLELKELIVKMQICSTTLLSVISKLFCFAEIDKNRIHKMEESLISGDCNPFISYMKQLRRYLGQGEDCHRDYMTYYSQARKQCEDTLKLCREEIKVAERWKKTITVTTATGAASVGGLSVVTGLFTLGASIPAMLGFGAIGATAAAGTAGVVVNKYKSQASLMTDTEKAIAEMKQIFSALDDFSEELEISMADSISILSFILGDTKQIPPQKEDSLTYLEDGYVIIQATTNKSENGHSNPDVITKQSADGYHASSMESDGLNTNFSSAVNTVFSTVFDAFISGTRKSRQRLLSCEEKITCEMTTN